MKKKTYLTKRNSRAGNPSYIKILLGAALALITLVVMIPLMVNQRPGKAVQKKPVTEGRNMIVKEVPKTPATAPEPLNSDSVMHRPMVLEEGPRVVGVHMPEEIDQSLQVKPLEEENRGDSDAGSARDVTPPKTWSRQPETALKDQPASGSVSDTNVATVKALPPAAPASAPEKHSSPGSLSPAASPSSSTAAVTRQEKVTGVEKSPPSTGDGMFYVVQVGSFQNRNNAEGLVKDLRKKGYPALIKPRIHERLGQIYMVQLEPVGDIAKANKYMSRIQQEENTKPILLKTSVIE